MYRARCFGCWRHDKLTSTRSSCSLTCHTQQAPQSVSKGLGASCSSPLSAGQQLESQTTGASAELPGGGSAQGQSTVSATAAALGAPGTAAAHRSAWGWARHVRRCRARGGAVQAIVSADYNGEIKVFIGFAGGLEGSF